MAKTPEQIKQSYYTNIAAKTSINIPDWMARIRAKHSLGHGHATLLAHDAMKAEEAG